MRPIALFVGMMLLSGCATSWYFGEWTITDVKFPGVSAISVEEAREWLGSEAIYSESRVSFHGESCRSPQFHIGSLTESDFQMAYRASFAELGIEGEAVDILRVTCGSLSSFPGSTFIKATGDMGYVPWDGAFFRLDRSSRTK